MKLMRFAALWALLCLLHLVQSTAAHAQTPLKKTLPNGLTVLALENRTSPVVSVRFYVKTGSIYEGKYLGTGISHLFEHTLFEGTSTRTKEQINDDVQSIGGQSNAYTSKDVTCYYITTAAPFAEKAVASLSDMMRNATFPEAEVKTQIGVIHNEMNLGEDDPDRTLFKLFDETAFKTHPTRFPIIGYRENFDRLTRADIVDYYATHYEPGNTILSVAGDIAPQRVFDLAAKYLGEWPRRNPASYSLPDEPRQTAPRRAVLDKDVQLTYLMTGWHTVPLQHPDLYALDVLAEIMGGGESSRLVRSLREKQGLVSSIGAFSSTPNYNAGTFGIRATLPPGNLAKVERAVLSEVALLKKSGVSTAELARAKRSIETSFVFSNDEVDNQAEQMAYDELGTGDPSYSRRYVSRIQGVTAAQVAAVARKYLLSDGQTSAIIRPRSAAVRTVVPTRSAERAGTAQMYTLSNGMRLIVKRNPASPTVAMVAMGLGGARLEPRNKAGVASMAARMLTRGTQKRTAEQIVSLVDDLGGSLAGSGGYNSWTVQSQWLSRDWRRGLSLVSESILTPTFPADELARVKAQTLAGIREQDDDPNGAASLLLRKSFYGAHPYGRNAQGTLQSVASITRADVASFWKAIAQPRSTVLAIYGDIDPQVARAAVELSFETWRSSGRLPLGPPASPELERFTVVEQTKPGLAQTALWFGFPSADIRGEDRWAIDVMDGALSGVNLPGGRLHSRLRDNQLVYVVHAYNAPGLDEGMFAIYANTTRENRERVQSIILEEVRKMRESGISEAELERAKSMAVAAQAIDNQSNSAQAQAATSDELFGLGFRESERYTERITGISLEDVRRVAQKYLREDNAALAVVGPTLAAAEPAPALNSRQDEEPQANVVPNAPGASQPAQQ
jgi:zinc protease